jgi:multiple sugar transport system substrate-binding protein
MTKPSRRRLMSLAMALALVLAACGGAADEASTETTAEDEPTTTAATTAESEVTTTTGAPAPPDRQTVTMWYHGAGNDVERNILTGIIDDFNASQEEWFVERQDFPQENYNESVTGAALSGTLPDIIDVDGPIMPNWAWAGYMAPLEIDESLVEDFLPGALGYWDDQLYSVGLWDAAVAVYARQSVLDQFGIRIPTLDEPWTLEEFDGALETLQASGEFEYAFDPGMAWTGEWYPYAFSPFLQSFGGDIIDRSTFLTAEGVLNGDEGIAFGEWWKSLFDRGLAPGTSQAADDRETGFIDGRYAMQWNGNWAGVAALEAIGDDLLFLPAPDFGNGGVIGGASWQFGVSADSEVKDGANAFIEFAIQDEYLAEFSDGIGLVPATLSAAALTENYAPGGPLEVFFELSQQQALIRPPTPAYLNAALAFEKALRDIADGADPATALDAATDDINADIESNGGYGF